MKRFFISIIIIAIFAGILQAFFPWWVIAIVAFAVGYIIRQNASFSFLSGFAAIFLLWVIYAWMLSHANNDILAKKIAMLLPLKGNVYALFVLTGIIGGLVAGFAALSGRMAGNLVKA